EDGVDLERALLGIAPGEPITVTVNREGAPLSLTLALAAFEGKTAAITRRPTGPAKNRPITIEDPVAARSWKLLGLKLSPVSDVELRQVRDKYNGGMKVVDVRGSSTAHQNGIRKGDILVGLHEFETKSLRDIDYIINKGSTDAKAMRFRVIRGREEVFGSLEVKPSIASGETTRR
ncbi:MAG: hypothetical protein NT069_17315, partial [Planctomycetota bacterium]|nr:hypothetical protein [Planctomycetota bacterium]